MSTAPVQVSIVIPCRNEAAHIERLLEALRQQTVQGFEVVVMDGASTDGTLEVVRRYPEVNVLPNPSRTIPAALNLGVRSTQREIIMRLDAHSRPQIDYVEKCLQALTDSQAEVVGGRWDVKAGGETTVAAAIAVAVSSPLGAGDAAYRLPSAKAGDVDTVPFGCFYRKTWEEVGGYDETFLTNEDYEFFWRIRQHGGRVYFDPQIRCDYFARPTLKLLAQQYGRYGWWKARVLRRHPRSVRVRQLIPILWSAFAPFLLFASIILENLWMLTVVVLGFYLWMLFLEAASYAALRHRLLLTPLIILAYLLIHFAWGWGAWVGLFSP